MKKIIISSIVLIAAFSIYTLQKDVEVTRDEPVADVKVVTSPSVPETKNSIPEVPKEAGPGIDDPQKIPESSDPIDRLEALSDPTEISILVLETMNATEISLEEKKEILERSVLKSSKLEAQNLLETIITTSSDSEILAEAFSHLARVSSPNEMQEFFDRLEIMSTYTAEKERAIQRARSRYSSQNNHPRR